MSCHLADSPSTGLSTGASIPARHYPKPDFSGSPCPRAEHTSRTLVLALPLPNRGAVPEELWQLCAPE